MVENQIYTIIRCEFEYKCSLDWSKLNETGDPKIRHCNECKKNVLLCLDEKEIDLAWENGICIAHPVYTEKMLKKIKDYKDGVGENPFNITMPMGLPSRSK